jgi:hypothetical protein
LIRDGSPTDFYAHYQNHTGIKKYLRRDKPASYQMGPNHFLWLILKIVSIMFNTAARSSS